MKNKAWNELTKDEIIELLKEDEICQKILDVAQSFNTVELCSGAIISIMKGKRPKDYDVFGVLPDQLIKIGAVFSHSSRTADSYILNGNVIQILKIPRSEFEYTISEFYAAFKKGKINLMNYNKLDCLKQLRLTPIRFSKKCAISCLIRLKHWEKKGFTIPEITYLSLVNAATKTNQNTNS